MSLDKNPNLIQIYWKGKLEKVHPGAKVETLLSEIEWEACQNGTAVIKDSQGHEIGLSGALSAGNQLHIEYIDKN